MLVFVVSNIILHFYGGLMLSRTLIGHQNVHQALWCQCSCSQSKQQPATSTKINGGRSDNRPGPWEEQTPSTQNCQADPVEQPSSAPNNIYLEALPYRGHRRICTRKHSCCWSVFGGNWINAKNRRRGEREPYSNGFCSWGIKIGKINCCLPIGRLLVFWWEAWIAWRDTTRKQWASYPCLANTSC